MLIKETYIRNNILESLEFINLDKNLLEIPIAESNDEYIINLERLSEFQYNYSDFNSMIRSICEANYIPEDKVKFSIYDSTILESGDRLLIDIPKDKIIVLNRFNESNDYFIKNALSDLDEIINEEFFQGQGIQHGKMWDAPDELVELFKQMYNGLEIDIKALFNAKSEEEFNMAKNAMRHQLISNKLGDVSRRHLSKNGVHASPVISFDAMNINDQQSWIDDLELEKYPKSKIAQLIQKLRGLYQGILHKWGRGVDYRVDHRIPLNVRQRMIGIIKTAAGRIAASILRVIDKLLRFLQNKTDKD